MSTEITKEKIDAYECHGVARLRSVISQSWIETLRVGTDRVLADPSLIYIAEESYAHRP